MMAPDAMETFLRVTLPRGGLAMVCAEMYFDESVSGNGETLCVAGYLFEKNKAEALTELWTGVLQTYGLDYFHMKECAHGIGQCKGLSKEVRIVLQTTLFELLKAHMEVGFSATFDLELAHLCPSDKSIGIDLLSPYAFCCYWGMRYGRKWASKSGFNGKIAYFFEAGDANQKQANYLLNEIYSNPVLREYFLYGGHGFVPKANAVLLQCADILAWQWSKWMKDQKAGNPTPRRDLLSLLEKPHDTMHFDIAAIEDFNRTIRTFHAHQLARRFASQGSAAFRHYQESAIV